jgi:hypothetical protein
MSSETPDVSPIEASDVLPIAIWAQMKETCDRIDGVVAHSDQQRDRIDELTQALGAMINDGRRVFHELDKPGSKMTDYEALVRLRAVWSNAALSGILHKPEGN